MAIGQEIKKFGITLLYEHANSLFPINLENGENATLISAKETDSKKGKFRQSAILYYSTFKNPEIDLDTKSEALFVLVQQLIIMARQKNFYIAMKHVICIMKEARFNRDIVKQGKTKSLDGLPMEKETMKLLQQDLLMQSSILPKYRLSFGQKMREKCTRRQFILWEEHILAVENILRRLNPSLNI